MNDTPGHTFDLGAETPGGEWAGQWVRVRPYLSMAADERIQKRAHTLAIRSRSRDQGDAEMDVSASAAQHLAIIIDEAVLDWHVLGADGEPLPPVAASAHSPQMLRHTGRAILDLIVDFYDAQDPTTPPRR